MNKNKILLADDNSELRRLLCDQLTPHGYEFDEAEDGAEAIEKLQKTEYDLLLLDIRMPILTGWDVLQFISENSLTCRVIMLTGTAGIYNAVKSARDGADDYVNKPYHVNDLLHAIERVLENPKSRVDL